MTRQRRGRSKRKSQRRKLWRTRTSYYQVAVPVVKRQRARLTVSTRLLSAVLLVVCGWLFYWFAYDDAFYITEVHSKGNWRLPRAELLALSGLEGVNVFWADTEAAERAIEALPDVESARVRCRLPANCVISLVERSASLVWRQGEAHIWIGSDGVAVQARGELPNAIVLDAVGSAALKPGDRLDPTLVTAVKELEQWQPEVRVYQYSEQYGLSFNHAYGWPVRLGDGREITAKLHLLHVLTDYFSREGVVPAFVDVRYPQAPYYGQ